MDGLGQVIMSKMDGRERFACYAPINSKLQHPPPRAYPGHLTVHRAWGGGNLNVALEGWGI